MNAGEWSVFRFVALALGAMCGSAVGIGCSASASGGGGEGEAVVEAPPPGSPAPPSASGGAVTPAQPDVIFEPSEVPVSGVSTPDVVAPRRRGLLEKQVSCEGDAKTTVSGTVYIPSGELPLYNAMVYVPDAELSPLTPGASCACEISGAPIVSALSDAQGRFVLENVPVGDDIPLVIQVGDWRREINIGSVTACTDNPIADRTLKLPARRSEGDLPKIAVATGFLDALECLVLKLGVDPSEFTTPLGGGSVQLFDPGDGTGEYAPDWNGGAPFPPGEALWSSVEALQQYDLVLLSCDGPDSLQTDSELQAMYDYANLGGRIFASHFQQSWFARGPAPFPELAELDSKADIGEVAAQVVTSFPKGQAMSEWLLNVGASSTAGQVDIRGAQNTIVTENPDFAQRWLATESPASVQYISANTPLGVADTDQCGRIVLSDIHVSPGDVRAGDDFSDFSVSFPNGCVSSGLSPQEAVLAFMLFDLSACIVPDDQAPAPPPIIR